MVVDYAKRVTNKKLNKRKGISIVIILASALCIILLFIVLVLQQHHRNEQKKLIIKTLATTKLKAKPTKTPPKYDFYTILPNK